MSRSAAKFLPRMIVAAFTLASLAATAANIDVAQSQITATFRQMNVPVEGRFNAFNGSIDFNPQKPNAGRARIEVDTASFDVGAEEYNDELHKKEWFDTSTYAKANFISSSVTLTGKNRFEAQGKFTLKGKTQDIKAPFTYRRDAGFFIYEGEFPISRKAYTIGSASWDSTVDDKVVVKFRIASPAK